MSEIPTNMDDVIDSRDVIKAIEDLEDDLSLLAADKETGENVREEQLDEINEELQPLKDLASQCEGYGDWEHGEQLIRDSYFEEYAQEFAEDIGAIDRNAGWPLQCIDWEQAARELKQDYMEVDFDGVTYWMRG